MTRLPQRLALCALVVLLLAVTVGARREPVLAARSSDAADAGVLAPLLELLAPLHRRTPPPRAPHVSSAPPPMREPHTHTAPRWWNLAASSARGDGRKRQAPEAELPAVAVARAVEASRTWKPEPTYLGCYADSDDDVSGNTHFFVDFLFLTVLALRYVIVIASQFF